MNRAYFQGLKVVAQQAATQRVFALFFDGTGSDNIARPPQSNLRNRQFRLICTFPSVTGNDQQIFNVSEGTEGQDRFGATYYSTLNGSSEFATSTQNIGDVNNAWGVQNTNFNVGNINTIIIDMGSTLLITNAELNGVTLTNPATSGSRGQPNNHSYRLGTRPDGSFPYKGVIIEWRDGSDVFNDDNDWGDFTITGAKRCYTDNFDDAIPTWRLASNNSIITL